jgi:hypothetical protein
MPSCAHANPEIKQQYINGHFCYACKFGLVTNGLGIVRHIAFYNKDWFAEHPQVILEKKSDSPDEDKSAHDTKLVIPTLQDFFKAHPLINPKTFLGDAAFDAIQNYKDLLTGDTFGLGRHFSKAYIPLNNARLENSDYTVNEHGIPCCPNDPSLAMKPESNTSHLRCGIPTFKFVCPKMKWVKCQDGKYRRRALCDNPCTTSKCGRMVYIYPEKDLRAFPGTVRGTDDWKDTYKIRTTVERSIGHFKDSFGLANRRTLNPKTLHADLLLAGIAQLLTLVFADKLHRRDLFRSVKSLIAA